MSKRKVTVFNTQGSKRTVVETTATTWGELQEDLTKAKIEFKNMRAIVGENQVTLESSAAILPVGLTVGDKKTSNFTLFLSAKKMKAGLVISRSKNSLALIKDVKEIIEILEARFSKKPKTSSQKELSDLAKRAREIERNLLK